MDEETVVIDFTGLNLLSKEEIRAAKKPKEIKAVNEYTYDGEYIQTFDSVRKAAESHAITTSCIYDCAVGTHLKCTAAERIFLYRGDDIEVRLAAIDKAQKKWKTGQDKLIDEYDLRGKFLCTYPTQKMAAKVNKVSSIAIGQCCKGDKPYIGKRIFLQHGDDIKKRMPAVKEALTIERNRRRKCKPVDQYTLEGKFVKAYTSASEAGRDNNIHFASVARCCHGIELLTTHGKIFLFAGSSISERLELIKQRNKNQL